MWAAVLNDENEFQTLVANLSSKLSLEFERISTATGAQIARPTSNPHIPCFAFAPDSHESILHVLLWLQNNIQPQVYVSTGLVRSCGSPFLESPYFVPDLCVRTAGRVDFAGVPILYEEFPFDPVTQIQIKSLVDLKTTHSQKIFGPPKDITHPENREWILKNFGAEATDHNISQFVRTIRSLGSASACLKVYAEAENPIEALVEAWIKIVSKFASLPE